MKVALHSVGYSGVWGGDVVLSIAQFARKAKDLGFGGIELMAKRPHLSPLDFGVRERAMLKEELSSLDMELSCLASYHDFSRGLEHPDMAALEKELVYLGSVLEIAGDLECPVVRVYSGYRHPGVPFEQQWGWCVDGLREACDLADEHDVFLGLQNHSAIASYTDEVLALINEVGSKRLKIVLDAPLLVERNEDLAESVKKCGKLIVHSHTSDFVYVQGRDEGDYFTFRRVLAVPLGEGVVDYPCFIQALKEVGYDGYLSYEMCCRLKGGSSEENLDRLAKAALYHTEELIRRA